MKATFSLPGLALLLVLAILGSCQNQAIAQGLQPGAVVHLSGEEARRQPDHGPHSRPMNPQGAFARDCAWST
jgi:hypothetical protein